MPYEDALETMSASLGLDLRENAIRSVFTYTQGGVPHSLDDRKLAELGGAIVALQSALKAKPNSMSKEEAIDYVSFEFGIELAEHESRKFYAFEPTNGAHGFLNVGELGELAEAIDVLRRGLKANPA